MPATKGRLTVVDLNGHDTTQRTFSIEQRKAPEAAPPSRVYRRGGGHTIPQLTVMARVANEVKNDPGKLADYGLEFGTDPHTGRATLKQTMMDQYLGLESNDQIVGSEFILRGDTRDWDTVHDAGGLGAHVPDVSTGDISTQHHVTSSTNTSSYVPATRQLGVAKYFAGTAGWIYLCYVAQAIAMNDNHKYRQDEVVAFGDVPLRDILMFKDLAAPDRAYLNRDYRASLLNQNTIGRCLRLIGGGTYPMGLFWAIVGTIGS